MYSPRLFHRCDLPIVAGLLLVLAGSVWACSVPVFRYALEHWNSDSYEAVVLHSGPLSEKDLLIAQSLGANDNAIVPRGNVVLRFVDISQSPKAGLLEQWKQAGSPSAPWLVISSPPSLHPMGPLWSGPLNETTVAGVLTSPARREITQRLSQGESAVWVLLESGDSQQDDAAAKLLETRLQYLSGVLELPKLDQQDIKNGLVSVPDDGLRLAFSVLRVSRSTSAEKFFVQMLLSTERDLKDHAEPMAFPVFGQARVLYALIGKGIRHETIDQAASFLIGSCSCQVKEQNPGADLLVTADWKALLKEQSGIAEDLPKVSEIVGTVPVAITLSPRINSEGTVNEACCAVRAWVEEHRAVAGVVVILGLGTASCILFRHLSKQGRAKS